jgi:hypothetical protein
MTNRFPVPWSVRQTEAGYVIDSAEGMTLALVDFDGATAKVVNNRRLSQEDARRLAVTIARLPLLLGRPQY